MADEWTPTAVANQALSAAGIDFVLGQIEEGTRPSQVILQYYTECLRQLLRAVHWDFARREVFLQLVADATGAAQAAGNNVGTLVPAGFTYSYNYPTNCMKVRFLPANYWSALVPGVPSGNIVPANSSSPLTTGTVPTVPTRLVPTRFLLTSDPNYIPDGAANNTLGISPIGQTLILSNVQDARCVYTFEASYPNLWDPLFREAMVAFLASKIAFPLGKDKKFARQIRADNIAIAQDAVKRAAATNGNETFFSSDLSVDWMRFRSSGNAAGYWGGGLGSGQGYLFGGVDPIAWGINSSAF